MGVCKAGGTLGEFDPYSSILVDYGDGRQRSYLNTLSEYPGKFAFGTERSFESELISANSTDFGAGARLAGIKATSSLLVESLLFQWTSAMAAGDGGKKII